MSGAARPPGPLRAPLLIAGAAFGFAAMGLCVKLASARYGAGEIVMYRSAVGVALMALLLRRSGTSVRSPMPWLHVRRGAAGVAAICLWFFAIAALPLATAMTLNYTSSVWMAALLVALGWRDGQRLDGRLVLAVLAGFAGVAAILRPTFDSQQWLAGLAGLASGVLSAVALLQVRALGHAGEPEQRIVFWFAVGGVVAGAALAAGSGGFSGHDARGVALLLATGVLASAAQLMMTRAYAIGHAMTNAVLQYLGIVFSFGFGVWLFDDPVGASAVAGMLLIVGAGVAATWLGRRRGPSIAAVTEN